MMGNKPNFFIAGAARSGTTSLWNILKSHPSVFMPQDLLYKEPAYFSMKMKNYKLENYLKLFQGAGITHQLTGEASTAYLTDPKSAESIYHFDPGSRIIILLRNPALRAYSLYRWMVQDGYEYALTFEDALNLEAQRKIKEIPDFFEPEYYYNYLYAGSGFYYEQVRRYAGLFGKNLLVLKFEDFITNNEYEMLKVYDFLGIDPLTLKSEKSNDTQRVKYPPLQFLIRKFIFWYFRKQTELETLMNKDRNELDKVTNEFLKDHLEKMKTAVNISVNKRWLIRKTFHEMSRDLFTGKVWMTKESKESRDVLLAYGFDRKPDIPINKAVYEQLISGYKEDIMKLSDLTGINFTDWLTQKFNQ